MKKLQKMNKAKRMFGKAHCNKGEYGLALLIACMLYVSCMPENIELPTRVKSVTTNSPTDVTINSATLNAHVDLVDTYNVDCGVIYGLRSNLSPNNDRKKSTTANGNYSVKVSELKPNTTYYYRAYALDADVYKYGEVLPFTTTPKPEVVDLGLSVKWASRNIGATSPEDYGGYYAWGETEEKSYYSWSTYKWSNVSYDIIMTKYCTDSYYGTVDNKTTLDLSDDVAHVKWGGSWRMPTLDEIKELINDCSWSWTTQNGVNGYKVTGPNDNSIFLPAAGDRFFTEVGSRGSSGYYWSGTLNEGDSRNACYLYFYSDDHDWGYYNYRNYGHTVRPVTE